MKCKVCCGAGVIQGQAPGLVSCCPACNGKGFIEQTNEEWFCGLSTEEKAKWITENLSVYADDWVKRDEKLLNPVTWVGWLKEKHE